MARNTSAAALASCRSGRFRATPLSTRIQHPHQGGTAMTGPSGPKRDVTSRRRFSRRRGNSRRGTRGRGPDWRRPAGGYRPGGGNRRAYRLRADTTRRAWAPAQRRRLLRRPYQRRSVLGDRLVYRPCSSPPVTAWSCRRAADHRPQPATRDRRRYPGERQAREVTHLVYSHSHADHIGASSLLGVDVVRIGHSECRPCCCAIMTRTGRRRM